MTICEGCLEKNRKIYRLQEDIKRLRQKLNYEQKKLKDGYFGSSTPSSKKPFKSNTQNHNNGGAKKGHKGYGRKSFIENEADKIIELPIGEKCPHCNSLLEKKGVDKRSIIDKVYKGIEKQIYNCEKKRCPKCKKYIKAKPVILPKALYGNQLTSEILVRHYIDMIPMNKIIGMYNLPSSNGCMFEMTHRIAKYLKPAVELITKDYRSEKVKHADETSWRQDGKSGYSWIFTSDNNIIFEFADNRSAAIPQKILGLDKLNGVLVVDRYAAYNKAPCELQYCFEHLKRTVKDLGQEFLKKQEVQNFVNTFQPLLVKAIKLRNENISNKIYYKKARQLKEKIMKIVDSPATHQGIKYIQYIFKEKYNRLYHWVNDRDIPADNNKAERDLRPTVIARKISFGSQSKKGAATRSVLMTVLQTAKKRLKSGSVVEWFKNVLDTISLNPKIDIYSLFP